MTLSIDVTKRIASIIAKTITAGCELEHFKLSDDWAGARGNNAAMAIADLFDDEEPDGVVGTLRRFLTAEQEANRTHGERNQKLHKALGMKLGDEHIYERIEHLLSLLTMALGVVEHPTQFTVGQRINLSREINDVLPKKEG